MARYRNILESDAGIEADMIRESKDLIIQGEKERRVEKDIETLIHDFKKRKGIDHARLKDAVQRFIQITERLLTELERAKRNAEQEEYKKLQELKELIEETNFIHDPQIRSIIGKIEKKISDRIESELKHYKRDERRLRRNYAPRGYILRKLKTDRGIEKDALRHSFRIIKRQDRENYTLESVINLIKENRANFTPSIRSSIRWLLKKYEADFDELFIIEVNFEIEQARLLHKIDQYIKFLTAIDIKDDIPRLQELRQRAIYWIKQDYRDSKHIVKEGLKIRQLARHVFLDDVATKEDLESIFTYDQKIGGISAAIYKKTQDTKPEKAVVFIGGMMVHPRTYDLLIRRLAFAGYYIISIALPQQGSEGKWRMGVMSEYVFQTVGYVRQELGIPKVAVIGHSMGGVASMLSAACYNQEVEDEIYTLGKEIEKRIEKMRRSMSKEEIYKELYGDSRLSARYKRLKQIILNSIKQRFRLGHIDLFIMLDPPRTAQSTVPLNLTRLLKFVPVPILRKTGAFMNNDLVNKLKTEPIIEGFDPAQPKKGIKMGFIEVEDVGEFLNYFCDSKNPPDYMKLLEFMGRKLPTKTVNGKETKKFIDYFLRKFVEPVPKLFLIASTSIYTRPFLPWNKYFTKKAYNMMGSAEIKTVKSSHFMSEVFPMPLSAGQGKLPVIAKQVLHFLEKNL